MFVRFVFGALRAVFVRLWIGAGRSPAASTDALQMNLMPFICNFFKARGHVIFGWLRQMAMLRPKSEKGVGSAKRRNLPRLLSGLPLLGLMLMVGWSLTTAAFATGKQTYVYSAPYREVNLSNIGFPSVSAAIQAIYPIYLQHWGVSQTQCPGYSAQYLGNGQVTGDFAIVTFSGPACYGAGYITGSLQLAPYSPGKNNGSGCSCDGGSGQSQGGVGPDMLADPISSSTGNKYQQEDDFVGTPWLTFRRFYNGMFANSTASGMQWRHSFDRSLNIASSGTITLFRPDGKYEAFTLTNGTWKTDPDIHDVLTVNTNAQGTKTGYTVFIAALRQVEVYDVNGVLQSVTDANGGGITLTYSTSSAPSSIAPGAGFLLTVTDFKGRQLTFTYSSTGQIVRVTEPDGGTLNYTYDSSLGNLLSVQYPDGSTRQYVYNESTLTGGASLPSAMTGVIDETGARFESTSYNSSGQATGSSLASGVENTQFTYNSNGTTTVHFPLGNQATWTYSVSASGLNQVASLDQPCGSECGQSWKSITYDANSNPSTSTDFNGNTTKTTYDANGLLDQQIEASGTSSQRTTNFTWNTTLRVPLTRAVLDANSNTISSTQWVYNTTGQTLARCDIDSTNSAASGYVCSNSGTVPAGVRRWTYSYCTAVDTVQCPLIGLLLTATGPRTDLAQATTYSYYMASSAVNCGTPGAACYQPGDLKSVTDALGHVTTIASYDADGRVTRVTDANGINTDSTYTPRGWVASRTVGGATTTLTYTPYGAVASITDPDGVVVNYTYDAAHRLTRITDALGNYVQYTLDAAGNKTAEQVFDSSGTLRKSLSRTYNTLGQLTQVTDGLSHAVFNASYSDSYDANGNLVHTADALGVQRKQGYDGLNRLVQTLDNYNGANPATQNTQSVFAYDANDRLQGVGDPDGLNTTYSYDGLGNVTAVQSPDTGTTTYVYDAAGNVLQRTDANGITRTSTYDALNRRTATTYSDSTLNVAYAYDEPSSVTGCSSSYPIGRLTRLIEANVTTVYCYDARGNVTQKRQIQGSATDVTTYSYTLADRLASTLTAAGTAIQYSRDADGRISGVTVLPPGTDGAGAGNVVTAVSYLPFGPITSYTLGNGQTITRSYDANYVLTDVVSPALNLHFARDAMGNITALGNGTGANPATETYSYDPLYRLTGLYDASGNAEETYTYSRSGDRLSKTATGLDSGAYGYQSGTHHLTAIGNASRVYDADGNTTGSMVGGNTYGFGYNGRNRMTVAQLNGSTVGTYMYSALGQRVAKVSTFPASTSQRFVYNESSQLLSEYGSNTRDYIWLDDLPVATVDTQGLVSTISYVASDGLNTPRAVTDGSGNTLWQWSYQGNSFGEQQPTSTTGYVLNLRFMGQYYDAESGLSHNGYRDYEAARGGYDQPDPLGPAGGPNPFAYVGGNPLSYVDPFGLEQGIAFQAIFQADGGVPQTSGLGNHYYNLWIPLCAGDCTPADAFNAMKNFSAPGAPPAQDGSRDLMLIGLTSGNPINQTVDPCKMTITNVTKPGHLFGGSVNISIQTRNGVVGAQVVGTGLGPNPVMNQLMGPVIFEGLGFGARESLGGSGL